MKTKLLFLCVLWGYPIDVTCCVSDVVKHRLFKWKKKRRKKRLDHVGQNEHRVGANGLCRILLYVISNLNKTPFNGGFG